MCDSFIGSKGICWTEPRRQPDRQRTFWLVSRFRGITKLPGVVTVTLMTTNGSPIMYLTALPATLLEEVDALGVPKILLKE